MALGPQRGGSPVSKTRTSHPAVPPVAEPSRARKRSASPASAPLQPQRLSSLSASPASAPPKLQRLSSLSVSQTQAPTPDPPASRPAPAASKLSASAAKGLVTIRGRGALGMHGPVTQRGGAGAPTRRITGLQGPSVPSRRTPGSRTVSSPKAQRLLCTAPFMRSASQAPAPVDAPHSAGVNSSRKPPCTCGLKAQRERSERARDDSRTGGFGDARPRHAARPRWGPNEADHRSPRPGRRIPPYPR